MIKYISNKINRLFSREETGRQNLSIEFKIDLETTDVKINLTLPTSEEISLINITELSETYAQLLVGIDYGLFKEKIFSNLMSIKKESTEPNTILFIDNVLSFYTALMKDLANKTLYYERPIISPSSAFKMYSNDKI